MTTFGQLFQDCLDFVIEEEGGFTNHPDDPGGVTGAGGVTLRSVRLRDHDKDGNLDFDLDGDGDVDEADMRLLQSDSPALAEYYFTDYWNLLNGVTCGDFGPALALPVFDCAINSGPRRAVALLQRALGLGLKVDGVPGPKTITASKRGDALTLYIAERGVHYGRCEAKVQLDKLASPQYAEGKVQPIFLRGWMRRLARVHERALDMVR
jgi:lysozyme family protein